MASGVEFRERMSDNDALLWNNERDPMLRSTIVSVLLLDRAAPIAMQAFDKDRPLWEFTLVEGLEQGRHALVMKLHHSVSDGVGLVRMTSSLVERSREPDPSRSGRPPSVHEEALASPERGPFEEALEALRHRAGADIARSSRIARALSVPLLGSMQKAIDFVTSNVPGPPYPVYVSGARVEQMFGFGPLSGSGVNVTLFS